MKTPLALRSDIDTYGDLDKELAPFKTKIAAKETLRKKIVARFEEDAADLPCSAEGDRYFVKLTPRTMKRVFKPGAMKRLANRLKNAFWPICEIPLGEFDENVTVIDRSKYVEEKQIGHRTIEVIEKFDGLAKAA